MADNVNAPSAENAGPDFGTKEESSVHYPDSLIRYLGADGTVLNGNRVGVLHGLPVSGNTAGDGSGTEKRLLVSSSAHQIVDVGAALPVGANLIGSVSTDQTSHGTSDLVAADITKVAGSPIAQGSGAAATAIRVELPTDSTGVIGFSGTKTSAATAPTGAVGALGWITAIFWKLGQILTVKTDQTTHGTTDLVANDMTGINGVGVDVGAGNSSPGTMRVVVATNQAAIPTTGGDPAAGTGTISVVDAGSAAVTSTLGQALVNGSATASSFVALAMSGQATARIQLITTNFNGTLVVEVSFDGGVTWRAVAFRTSGIAGPLRSSVVMAGVTDTQQLIISAADYTNVRVRAIARSAGTVDVVIKGGGGQLECEIPSGIRFQADAKQSCLQSVKITLNPTPGTVTVVNIPDTAQGFTIYARSNTVRFAVNEVPVLEVASSSTPVTVFGAGGLAQNQQTESRILPDLTSRTLKLLSDTASSVCDVTFF